MKKHALDAWTAQQHCPPTYECETWQPIAPPNPSHLRPVCQGGALRQALVLPVPDEAPLQRRVRLKSLPVERQVAGTITH